MKRNFRFIALLLIVALLIILFPSLKSSLSFEFWKSHLDEFRSRVESDYALWFSGYFALYVFSVAVSFPGAAVLTVVAGALFGFWQGLLLVSFASTVGADLAFLLSRFFFSNLIRRRYHSAFQAIDKNVQKEGAFYLFAVRLNPVFPFFLTNLVMGLTRFPLWSFHWVSQIAMLPGTAVYVNAGRELGRIDSLQGLVSVPFLLSLAALGLVPLIAKKVFDAWKAKSVLRRFEKPKAFDYNVVVIGAGAAGLVASYIAAFLKAKVLLIEKNKMGGDCLNTGCVPSKALLAAAKNIHAVKKTAGVTVGHLEVDFRKVMDEVHQAIREVEPHDSVERYTGLGVECLQAEAKIRSPYVVEAGGRKITARNIILATGAAPRVPKIPGLRGFLTSETIWELRELPRTLLVLGGGAIGCEMAQAFRRLGSRVILIECCPRLLPHGEPEASEVIQKALQEEGVELCLGVEAKEFREQTAILSDGRSFEFTHILTAMGRQPRWKGFGLEELGLLGEDPTLQPNEFLQTKIPNIWVCGDATGLTPLTHLASHEAWYASVNALFSGLVKFKLDLRVVPSVVYTDPEVARVGKMARQLDEEGTPYDVTFYEIGELDRAISERSRQGFVKILTAQGSDRILGATIVGSRAGDMLAEITLAMKHHLGLRKILQTIHPYPTWSEANKAAAGQWARARKPERALQWLEKFHRFRRGSF
jgi:pyruvate/2-oxoglutarate dehydrogenase complex dihydrolipoamide dehydrogenase (E3) component/uncharacterized membrane protein YdjX (TVP38/TMEM64 family)